MTSNKYQLTLFTKVYFSTVFSNFRNYELFNTRFIWLLKTIFAKFLGFTFKISRSGKSTCV